MAKILVTGFNGFQGKKNNPSFGMLRYLPAKYGAVDVVVRQVPTEWGGLNTELLNLLNEVKPDAVVMFGLKGSNTNFEMEKLFWNWSEGTDNKGIAAPKRLRKEVDVPVAAVSPITPDQVAKWIAAGTSGVTTTSSHDAGTYLCNAAGYYMQATVVTGGYHQVPWMFVHVPANTEDPEFAKGYQRLPIDAMAQAAADIVAGVAVDYFAQSRITGWGATSGYGKTPPQGYVSPVVLKPLKADPPRSWWPSTPLNVVNNFFLEYGGGIKGLPPIETIKSWDTSSLNDIDDFYNSPDNPNKFMRLSPYINLFYSSPDGLFKPLLADTNPGIKSAELILHNPNEYYTVPCIQMLHIKGSRFGTTENNFWVTGVDVNGYRFVKQFKLTYPAGATKDTPGTFVEVTPATDPGYYGGA